MSLPRIFGTTVDNVPWSVPYVHADPRRVDHWRRALAHGMRMRDFGGAIREFSEMAALIGCLDVVIAVDTAVAHLAGAMGAPVWLLVAHAPEWRWLLEREGSPWYPSARIFRQKTDGDWPGVMERVAAELDRLAARP